MRILLTGGSGQVGAEFLRRSSGLDVLAPRRSELDLSQPEAIPVWLHRHRPDLILSVGAYTAVDRAEDEPEIAFRVNRDAVTALAEYANGRNIPLVHISTDYVFDGSKDSPYTERDIPSPQGVYGASKLAGEHAAQEAKKHLILRVSWVFGALGANFVRTMLRLGTEREHLRVVDDQFGGPTWAGHIADTLLKLTERVASGSELPQGLWHHAGTPFLSWHAFAVEIFTQAKALGILSKMPVVEAIPSSEFVTKAKRPANSRLDSRAASEQLKLPAPDWRVGLQETLKELAAH